MAAVAPSFDDLLTQYEAQALAVRPTAQFLEGDITTIHQHGTGAMADAAIRFTIQAFKQTFIDGATGDALTTLVNDHLNIQRQAATAAQAVVTFTRTGGGPSGVLPTGFVVGSAFDATGKTVLFTLDAPVAFGSSDNGPHTGNVTAQVTGRASNVPAGGGGVGITRVVGVLPTGWTNLAVTNAGPAAGGNDDESDDELRVRARTFWVTLRRGTLGAIEFGALQVASVRVSRATEDPVSGIVTLVVTDSDGNSTAQMVSDVVAELENWRAAGSVVTIFGGTQLLVNITGTLVGDTGVNTSVLAPLARAAITARINKQRQGEILYLDSVKSAALSVDPDALDALVLTAPLADVTPAPAQVIRAGIITIS